MPKRKKSATVDFKVRMKEPLRAALETAAKRRGISMNAEAVDRLEQSFRDQDRLEHFQQAIYGRQLSAILEIIGRVMRDAAQHAAFAKHRTMEAVENWSADPYAYDQAVQAAHRALEALRPHGPIAPPQRPPEPTDSVTRRMFGVDMSQLDQIIGAGFANSALGAIERADPEGGELGRWGVEMRRRLGRMAENLEGWRDRLRAQDAAAAERLAKPAVKGRKEKGR